MKNHKVNDANWITGSLTLGLVKRHKLRQNRQLETLHSLTIILLRLKLNCISKVLLMPSPIIAKNIVLWDKVFWLRHEDMMTNHT
jgi:hypothetical protein